MSTLQFIWFALIAVQLIGYTVFAGFDLGVGFWYLVTRNADERQAMLGAIGPFWDGNQVWLVTAGAALFAAFPAVYATLFSSFYLALMLLLFALIIRTVAIEYSARGNTPRARTIWGAGFAVTSIVSILLLGVAFGNILRGLPLDQTGVFTGTFFSLLNPFSLLIGVLNLALLSTHGALYLAMKAKNSLAAHARTWVYGAWLVTFPLVLAALIITPITQPHLLINYLTEPVLWVLPVLAVDMFILIPIWNARGKVGLAFAASCAGIALLLISAAAALFPVMIPALNNPDGNLTATNASSSYLTLKIMLIIAAIGLPLVYAYTIWSYRVFRGKMREEEQY